MKYRTTDKHPNGSGLIIEYSEDMKMYRSPQGSNYTPGEISAMNDLGWFERVEEERIRVDHINYDHVPSLGGLREFTVYYSGPVISMPDWGPLEAALNNDPREGWAVDQMRKELPKHTDRQIEINHVIGFLDHLETLKPEKTKWVWEGGPTLAVSPNQIKGKPERTIKPKKSNPWTRKAVFEAIDLYAKRHWTQDPDPDHIEEAITNYENMATWTAEDKPRTYSEAEVLDFARHIHSKVFQENPGNDCALTRSMEDYFTPWSGQELAEVKPTNEIYTFEDVLAIEGKYSHEMECTTSRESFFDFLTRWTDENK